MDDIKTRRIVVTTMGTADVLTHVVKKGKVVFRILPNNDLAKWNNGHCEETG